MKAEEALREFAEKWGYKPDTYKYKDEFGKDTGVTIAMCTYTEEKDELLSDLTALISEHYVAKEEVDKMVSERLREELIAYEQWMFGQDNAKVTTTYIKEYIDEYLKSRER